MRVCRVCSAKEGKGVKFRYLNKKGLKLRWEVIESLPKVVPSKYNNPVICERCIIKIIGVTDIKQEPEEFDVGFIKQELSALEVINDDLLINTDIPECFEKQSYCCYHCDYSTKIKADLVQHIHFLHKKKEFQCDSCIYSTNSKIRWRTHLELHFKKMGRVCNECGFRTLHYTSFLKHKLLHSERKLYKCPYCGLRTNHQYTVNYHKMMHMNLKPFRCNLCNFSTRSKHYLKYHKKRHRDEKKNFFQCDICHFSTSTKQNLKAHKLTHQNLKPFQCDVCNFRTRCKYYVRKHILLHQHIKKKSKYSKNTNVEENSTKVCRICLLEIDKGVKFHYLNRKGLKLQWNLTESVREVDLNPVICKPCVMEIIGAGGVTNNDFNPIKQEPVADWDVNVTEEVFFNEILTYIKQEPGVERIKEEFGMGMINEEVTHYAEASASVEKPTYYCHDCGYGAKLKSYLARHIFKHHKKKKFQCDQCDYSCVAKHRLQKHSVLHLERKRYSCENCDFSTPYFKLFQRHKASHSEEKIYDCGFHTVDFDSLKHHKMTHPIVKPFRHNVGTSSKVYLKSLMVSHQVSKVYNFLNVIC